MVLRTLVLHGWCIFFSLLVALELLGEEFNGEQWRYVPKNVLSSDGLVVLVLNVLFECN